MSMPSDSSSKNQQPQQPQQEEQQQQHHVCTRCGQSATLRCSRCKAAWYCSKECQTADWKTHKAVVCNDQFQADQHTLHKREFDRIIQHYQLDADEKAEEISTFLTSSSNDSKVTAPQFAQKFGTTEAEAVVFLEWINIGVKFKQQTLDTAKQSGFL